MSHHCTCIQFHPVGQGIFSTGCICCDRRDDPVRWFYDCGTASEQMLITNAIAKMGKRHECCGHWWPFCESSSRTSSIFHLGAISHFDQDHVNGVSGLMEGQKLKILLLPYATLAQRLYNAFTQSVQIDSDFVQFCANPARFARERWGAERVLFVEGGSPAGDPNEARQDNQNREDQDSSIQIPRAKLLDPELSSDAAPERGILPAGSVLGVKMHGKIVWEFRPYNDQHLASKLNANFADGIAKLRDALLRCDAGALKGAEQIFNATFGKTAQPRNEISLFLHGMHKSSQVMKTYASVGHGINRHPSDKHPLSILYTGDGFLNTQQRVDEIKKLPLQNLTVLQVPHHGARKSWMTGLGAELAPRHSVFCADPERIKPGHPHGSVLVDLLGHGPAIVDKRSNFCVGQFC